MSLTDANHYPGRLIETDLAVVGSGAVGLALAREFAGTGVRVALIEAGGMRPRRRSQSDYRGRNTGRDNFSTATSRFRCFGGSTTVWGGQCRPLDPLDFEVRDGIPWSGWPFDWDHLQPYYRRAQAFCQVASVDFLDLPASPLKGDRLESRVYGLSNPVNLAAAHQERLASASNVTVYLNAQLLEIESDPSGAVVTGLRFGRFRGRELRVQASCYVLGCGGIENARLLLASNRQRPGGLGNDNDLVGRFFMDHPYVFPGYLEPGRPDFPSGRFVLQSYDPDQRDSDSHGGWGLPARILRRERLNGACVYLVPRPKHKTTAPYWSSSGRALLHLIEVLQGRDRLDGRLWHDLAALTGDVPNLLRTTGDRLTPLWNHNPVLGLRIGVETTPCPRSRVTLGRTKDRWGMPRVEVHWQLNQADLRGYQRLLEVFRSEIARLGLGRLVEHGLREPDGWPGGMTGGKHHIGTTRMHQDPRQGVVDPDCRVHGMDNLYIGGSSVFPTAGYANPTLTIAALAIRLADRLKERLGAREERGAAAERSA